MIASIQTKYAFGLTAGVSGSVYYLDEQTIVYPVGANCVLYNVDQKSQKLIQCSVTGAGITALAVSPNKRYAAVAEKGEKPLVTIYDLSSLRKRKTLSYSESQTQEFTSLAFSPDSKYLITQGGRPDWTLVYWGWEKSKLMATFKTSPQQSNAVHQVSFNPQDNTQICAVGDGIFKLLRYNEGSLKQFAFQKTEPLNYLCHTWVSEDRLLLGAESGKVQLYEVGDLKHEYEVSVMRKQTSKQGSRVNSRASSRLGGSRPTSQQQTEMLDVMVKELVRVDAIVSYSKGFICSGGSGTLHLFDKIGDDKSTYKKSKIVMLSIDPTSLLTNNAQPTTHNILSLALSPSEENVICATTSQQLYNLAVSTADLGKAGSGATFDYLSQSFHHGPITGMDACVRKPIIATCSLDKSVRIWNYENSSLDIYKEFQEEAYSVALHPSGLFVLVGFSEKLRLLNILIDDVRVFKEIAIRGCRECVFSNGGHLFAAVSTNLIQLFATYTFDNIGNLKGHNGKVRCLVWSHDDTSITSCSMDGAIYEWNVLACRREKECVLKTCAYTSISLSPDLRSTFAVGTDHTLKEIILAEANIVRQINSGDVVLTQVCMSRSGRMMFTGTSSGMIRAVRVPLTDSGDHQDYPAHAGSVSRIKMSYDDQYLFSAGDDGSLFVFRVQDKDARGLKRDRDISYAEEILITKSDLEEKNAQISELKTRVDELKMENEYQLRLKDMSHTEKLREVSEGFVNERDNLLSKYETLTMEKEKEAVKHEDDMHAVIEKHNKELQEIENANNQKLMAEYEKYQELQARSQKLQEDYERQLGDMGESKETALADLTEFYQGKLEEMESTLQQMQDQQVEKQRENDETQRQIEEDTDREILELKNRYERQLRQEKEDNMKLKGDAGIMKKKVSSLQGDIETHKSDISRLQSEVKKRDSIISSLKNDIDGLKKEIQERDDTIQDKEKRIYDLKKKNQELEKFKFVLDYKIKELKRQMEPRENEIKEMKEQIRKMEAELEESSRDNKALLLAIENHELKLKATTKEMNQERQQVHNLKVEIQGFKANLHNTTRFIQEPKQLKETMKEMYKRYLRDYDQSAQAEHAAETDTHAEYARQREHLEKSVASLRKKLTKDTEIHRADNIRVMQENVTLLKEINDLRKELKGSRTQIHDLEALLNVARKNGFDETRHTAGTVKNIIKPTGLGKTEPNDNSRLLDMQKIEISKLRNRIRELEITARRPQSGDKLPPVHPMTAAQ